MSKRTLAAAFALAAGFAVAGEARYGLPWDWSHRAHIVNPDLPGEAMAKGEYDAWLRNTADPRFMSQLIRKFDYQAALQAEAAQLAVEKARGDRQDRRNRRRGRPAGEEVNRDWSNVMGGAGGTGVLGTYPAKYGFDINAAPDCANDFVVYGTGASGQTGAGTMGTRLSNAITGSVGNGNTVTITNGTRQLVLTAHATLNTGLNFANVAPNGNRATNLAAAINRNGGTVGVTATAVGTQVRVTAITHANPGITLAETLNNFSWGGNVPAGTGTAGQPTIIAFNQLYKTTCDDAANPPVRPLPNTFWAYNTGVAAFVETSPILSLDGTQVAFIERTGATASLVMLKWSSTVSVGTIGAPTVPALAASGAAYRACAAPCMFKISLGTNNTRSSPYYDYAGDELWVGAANGTLHKFTGIFVGNPAAAGAPWPVTVSTGNALSSPVFDGTSVFVGSALGGAGAGGRLHRVSAAGAVVSSAAIGGAVGGANGTGVAESPMVDTAAGRVYTFVATDTFPTGCQAGADPCQAVHQFSTAFAANDAGIRAPIGRGGQAARTLRMGAFDNAYWASTPATPTGFLYACGSTDADTDDPVLWRVPITGGTMSATAQIGPALTNGGTDSAECSPITEVMNGVNDYLFLSVPAAGNDTGCTGACIYMYNLTTMGAWGAGVTAAAGLQAPGGTGGIIIDNISTTTGASQIYYSTRTNPGNAIQASQGALN
jgi:hypothetical protein